MVPGTRRMESIATKTILAIDLGSGTKKQLDCLVVAKKPSHSQRRQLGRKIDLRSGLGRSLVDIHLSVEKRLQHHDVVAHRCEANGRPPCSVPLEDAPDDGAQIEDKWGVVNFASFGG